MRQHIEQVAKSPPTAHLLKIWRERADDVVERAVALQSIPAPTFAEQDRAEEVSRQFTAIGLADVEQDAVGNVYARTPGKDPTRPALLVSAHLDTVFPKETDLTTRFEADGRIIGAGIGDNSLGLAALISLADVLTEHDVTPACDIWWVATVGEEGLGDLRGIRAAVNRLGERLGTSIILEGIGLGWIYNAALGVRRLRITVEGPGGHSWLHPAPPSAIHHLLKLGAALVDEIIPPETPRSSFNIGLIDGGTSINTRAPKASISIDLRSVDRATLTALEARIRDVASRFTLAPGLALTIDVIGDRPSARLSSRHPLVRAAQETLATLGGLEPSLSIGSTDANIPLAAGIPSVCIGITTGGNPHTTSEYIDTQPVSLGMQQVTLLTLVAAQNTVAWSQWLDDEEAGPG